MKSDHDGNATPAKAARGEFSTQSVSPAMYRDKQSKYSLANTRHPDADLVREAGALSNDKRREIELMDRVTRLLFDAAANVAIPEALRCRSGDKDILAQLGVPCLHHQHEGERVKGIESFERGEFLDLDDATSRRRCAEIVSAQKEWERAIDAYDRVNDWFKIETACEELGHQIARRMPTIAALPARTLDGVFAKLDIVSYFDDHVSDMRDESGGVDQIVWSIIRDLLVIRRATPASPAAAISSPALVAA